MKFIAVEQDLPQIRIHVQQAGVEFLRTEFATLC